LDSLIYYYKSQAPQQQRVTLFLLSDSTCTGSALTGVFQNKKTAILILKTVDKEVL